MFRRLLRVTLKLALIAAVGFAVAAVVKKLTTPPPLPEAEPWPPLQPDERGNGETSSSSSSSSAANATA